jgi:tetratricopeptide (TPR) repeat protein
LLEVGVASDGGVYFALSLTDHDPDGESRAIDLGVVVDLSASQSGPAFRRTVKLTQGVVEGLLGGGRVQIWLANRPGESLLDGPAAVGSQSLAEGLARLDASVPSGATDLSEAFTRVENWLSDRVEGLSKRVLVVGDGRSTVGRMDQARVASLVERLLLAKAPLSFVAVGEGAGESPLRSVAVSTGGRTWRAGGEASNLAKEVRDGVGLGPLYVSSLEIEPAPALVLPTKIPPLRTDVQTLVAGRWNAAEAMRIRIRGDRNGSPAALEWSVAPKPVAVDAEFLGELVELWKSKSAAPALFDAPSTLARARATSAAREQALAAQAKAALAERRLDDAEACYESMLARQPGDLEAEVGLRAVRRLRDGSDPRPNAPFGGTPPLSTPTTEAPVQSPERAPLTTTPDVDLPAEAKARAAIEKQRAAAEVSRSLEAARAAARSNVDEAIRILKRTLESLVASGLDEDVKTRLRGRLESQLRALHRERRQVQASSVERAAARGDRQAAGDSSLRRQRQQLVERFLALTAERLYGEAEAVADQFLAAHPDSLASAGAALNSRLAHRYERIEDVENRKQEGWRDALHAVESSTTPFPDSATLLFPPAKDWEALTIRREKYKVVTLAAVSPAEERIRRALTRPATFDFRESPLSDVLQFLREYAGVNIVADRRGLEDAGVDLDEPITLSLEHVPLKSALNLLLGPLELAYLVRDDVLLITSRAEADAQMTTKVYPAADLVVPIQDFNQGGFGLNGFNVGNNPQSGGPGLGGRRGAGLGGFGGGGPAPDGRAERMDAMSEELRGLIQRALGDQSSAGGAADGGVLASGRGPWDRHFEQRVESESSIRAAAGTLVEAGRGDLAFVMLEAVVRNRPASPWTAEATAIAAQLAGLDEGRIRSAVLSVVDVRPDDLSARLWAARELSAVGQTQAALALLRDWEERAPGSLNACFLALELAALAVDVEVAAWAADRILSRDWPGECDEIHERVRKVLGRLQGALRGDGRNTEADRLSQVVQGSLRRDLEITIRWEGAADVDLSVVEPGGYLCSNLTPRTIGGGVLATNDSGNMERYVAAEAFSGEYEARLTPVWGRPVGGVVTLDVVYHRGGPSEKRERRTVQLGAAPESVRVSLEGGRRRTMERIDGDARLALDGGASGGGSPLTELRRILQAGRTGADPERRNAPAVGGVAFGRSVPFAGVVGTVAGGAVAFDPVVEVLQDGLSLQAQAVVSADRRFVRLTLTPLLQNIQSVADVRTIQVGGTAGGGGVGVVLP